MRKPDYVKEAMNAQTNLNVFASIAAILEGGCVFGGPNKAADRIVAICKTEQQRQLRIMDAARAKADNQKGGLSAHVRHLYNENPYIAGGKDE